MQKNKIVKKLSDWKTWIFIIIPLILIVTYIVVLICLYVKKSYYNQTAIITAMTILIFAVCLMCVDLIYKSLKRKSYAASIVSLILLLCYVGLHITAITYVPKLFAAAQDKERALQEYEQTSADDPDYGQKRDAYLEASEVYHNVLSTSEYYEYGSLCILCLISLPLNFGKKDDRNGGEQTAPDTQTEKAEV